MPVADHPGLGILPFLGEEPEDVPLRGHFEALSACLARQEFERIPVGGELQRLDFGRSDVITCF